MARRDLRQLGLADSIVRRRGKKSVWLEHLDAALDWPALETIVAGIYASREGGLSYPLLTYVKLLLLQQWYGLSDEGLEAAVDDRLSFRRFAGIPLAEAVPDHSSIWRFREQLARRGLAEKLLAEVNRQLDTRGLILRRGTLIDATIIGAAVRPPGGDAGEVAARDPQAGWTKKNGRSRFGYKAHAAVDEGSGLVREAVMTPADVHDSDPADGLVRGDEQAVYADKAYDPTSRYPYPAEECSARAGNGHRSGASALWADVRARLADKRTRPGQLRPGCLPRRHHAEDPDRGDEPAAGRTEHAREQAHAPRHPGAGPPRHPGRTA